MYKTILVVTDGSEAATRAVEFASELAAKFEVSLVIGLHQGDQAKCL